MSPGVLMVPAMLVGWFVSSLVPAKPFGAHHAAAKAAVAGAATAVAAVLVFLLAKRFSL